MNMLEAVGSCFRKYFKFSGRARRSEFWYWVLFTIIAGIVFGILDSLFFGWESSDVEPLGSLFSLATLFPGLAVSWRRLHDTGRSGWWIGGSYLVVIAVSFVFGMMFVSLGLANDLGNIGFGVGLVAALLVLMGLAYWILLIVFFCQDSHFGPNKYGPNPKDDGNVSVFD